MINRIHPLALLLLALFVISATGCRHNDNNAYNFNGPWLKTETYTGSGGTSAVTYTYDSQHRLTAKNYSDGSVVAYQYNSSTIVETESSSMGTNQVVTYGLNNDGYAVIVDGVNIFTYDAQHHVTGLDDGDLVTFVYNNGNLTSETTVGSSVTYQYLTNKTNTIGQQNYGLTWAGVQSTNLMSSEARVAGGSTVTVTYTYEYDGQNRVTKRTDTHSTGVVEVWEYTYY
jgi:YD repeat-containing protein